MSIHVKTAAGWEEIGAGGGVAEGSPPAPLIDAASQAGGSVIKFTSGGDGAAGPTLAYGATITPDATVTVDQDNLEVAVSGTEPFTDYVVEVYGVNIAGRGEVAKTGAFQLNYNDAIGGDVPEGVIVDNYNGTGQKWRVHTFVNSATFKVKQGINPWDATLVAGGGGGGTPFGGQPGWCGGGGGGYTLRGIDAGTLTGDVLVTIGFGGGEYAKGSDTSIAGLGQCGGGGCGWRGDGWSNEKDGRPGTWGGTSTGGTALANVNNFTPWPSQNIRPPQGGNPPITNAGRGGAAGYSAPPPSGDRGYAVIAYQIGTSTTREIAQAEAEAAAREAGYATGYDVGVTDGYDAARDDLQAAVEASKEAEENPATMDDE